jgi:hypothetical protein
MFGVCRRSTLFRVRRKIEWAEIYRRSPEKAGKQYLEFIFTSTGAWFHRYRNPSVRARSASGLSRCWELI